MGQLKRSTRHAVVAFVMYELERHLKTLLVGWLLLLVPALAHRLIEGHWGFFRGDWPSLAFLCAWWLLLPTLAAVMAMSGWAKEREDGVLEWLYARPWGSGHLFFLRVGAVLVSSAVWIGGCFLLYRPSLSSLVGLDIGGELTLQRVAWVGLSLLTLGMGTGFWAGAVAATRSDAFKCWILWLLALLATFVFLNVVPLPTRGVLRFVPQLERTALEVFLWMAGLGALFVSGWIMRRAPGEPKGRSGFVGLGLVLLGAAVAYVAILLQPMRLEPDGLVAVRDLGEDVRLELVRARHFSGFRHRQDKVYHPVVRGPSKSRVFRDVFVRGPHFSAHAESGRAMLRRVERSWTGPLSDWILIDRDGGAFDLELTAGAKQVPLGWSTDGQQFAWRASARTSSDRRSNNETGHLLILGVDRQLREVSIPDIPREDGNSWTATWLDAEHLLITNESVLYSLGDQDVPRWTLDSWWMIVSSEGESITGLRDLPGRGWRLFSPSLGFAADLWVYREGESWGYGWFGGIYSWAPLARVGKTAYFILGSGDTGRLVSIDLIAGELHEEAHADWNPRPVEFPERFVFGKEFVSRGYVSLGSVDEEILVWTAETSHGETAVLARSPDSEEVRQVCTFAFGGAAVGGFRGATRGWAIWADENESTLYACHLDSGTARQLIRLGPLGARSVDINASGVLGLKGWIDLWGKERMGVLVDP